MSKRKKPSLRCPVHGRKMRRKGGCPECARPPASGLGATGDALVAAAKARYPDPRSQAHIDYLAAAFCSPDGAQRVGAQQALYKMAWGQDVTFK